MKTSHLENTVCLFCKHDKALVIIPRRFPRFVVCRTCGLVYQNPRLNEPVSATHYQAEYWEARRGQSKQPNFARAKGFADILTGFLAPNDTVLEVGCGRGEILMHLHESFDVQVVGIEPSAFQAAETRENYGIPIVEGRWPDILRENVLQTGIRAIVFSHVVEHFFDPRIALEACHRVLVPEGLIAIEVPNIRKPNPAKALSRWLAPEHTYYFSRNTLERLLYDTGFLPIAIVEDIFIRVLAQRNPESKVFEGKFKNELGQVVLSLLRHEIAYWPRYSYQRIIKQLSLRR